ncbi:MAG: glycosyltransferase [Parabacteroides sp.]|nr:glycosyltransferase [Parabacteroides sp.]
MIRILMVLGNTRRGGTQAFIMNILRNVDKNKYQIDVAVTHDSEGGYGEEIISLGSNIYIMPDFQVWNIVKYIKEWKKLLSSYHYDIVHAHSTNSAGLYLRIAKEQGCATISHSHSAGYRGGFIARTAKKIFSRTTKSVADYWFACSDKAAYRLYGNNYKTYGHYSEIPNAIDVSRYTFDSQKRNNIRQSLNITSDTFLCGHVGTFSEPKNHSFILAIFKEICSQRDNCRLLLIGEGVLEKDIKEKAAILGVLDKIIFLKNISNINEYLMGMDLFIFPSFFEGLSFSLVEAQCTGLNIIMSETISTMNILTDCVKPISLLRPAKEWADIGLNMSEKNRADYSAIIGESKYNLENAIKQITAIYDSMTYKKQ